MRQQIMEMKSYSDIVSAYFDAKPGTIFYVPRKETNHMFEEKVTKRRFEAQKEVCVEHHVQQIKRLNELAECLDRLCVQLSSLEKFLGLKYSPELSFCGHKLADEESSHYLPNLHGVSIGKLAVRLAQIMNHLGLKVQHIQAEPAKPARTKLVPAHSPVDPPVDSAPSAPTARRRRRARRLNLSLSQRQGISKRMKKYWAARRRNGK